MARGRGRARGTKINPRNRYHSQWTETVRDRGWGEKEGSSSPVSMELQVERSRNILSRNDSPDVPFDRSVNPYRGCEHGCVYCYARPGHAWLDLSPGLDFETRLFCRPDAPWLLRRELAQPGYRPAPLALGSFTDAYQPVEREQRITRRLLELLSACRHPVCLVTKSALVERDIDLLAEMASQGLARCAISVTTLEKSLSKRMEPRAAAPARRLKTIQRLSSAGVPVTVLLAPVIPALNDHELERILTAAREAGATSARMVLLRLPMEVGGLFENWLREHYPGRAGRVMELVRELHDGRLNDSRPGMRMTGTGPYAEMLGQRFNLWKRRLGFQEPPKLRVDGFRKEWLQAEDPQLTLPGF